MAMRMFQLMQAASFIISQENLDAKIIQIYFMRLFCCLEVTYLHVVLVGIQIFMQFKYGHYRKPGHLPFP